MRTHVTAMATLLAACGLLFAIPAAAQELGPTLQRIQDNGTITIGHREASVPFSYIGDNEEPVGYTIDICMQVVDDIEERLGQELDIEWVTVTPQTRIPLMANGTIDLECGSTTNTLTRQQQVDYSYITYITGTKLLTKKGSGVESVEDLSGNTIALAQGTTNERAVKEAIKERDIEDVDILSVEDHDQGFLALKTDRVDAYSTDDVLLFGLIADSRNPDDYHVVGDFLSYDPYAIMVPPDDSQFRLQVNKTLARLFRNGKIHDIYEEWFEPMNVPMSDLLQQSIRIHTLPQ